MRLALRLVVGLLMGVSALALTGCEDQCEDGKILRCVDQRTEQYCEYRPSGRIECWNETRCTRYACVNGSDASTPWKAFKPAVKLANVTADQAMSWIANGDRMKSQSYGLQSSDLSRLSVRGSLAADRYEAIAAHNGEKVEIVKAKLESLAAAFQEQRKDDKSAYWQTCVQSGSWATDRNLRCEQTWWPGCSAASGAMMCVTKIGKGRLGL